MKFVYSTIIVLITLQLIFTTTATSNVSKIPVSPQVSRSESVADIEDLNLEKPEEFIDPVFYNVPLDVEIQLFIKNVCEHYRFEEELIYQICYCESKFDVYNSLPNNSCKGLMAVSTKYAPAYFKYGDKFDYLFEDKFDPFNSKQNIVIGVRMLDYWRRTCRSRGYQNIKSALQCYNRGFSYFKNPSKFGYANWVLSTRIEKI